MRKELVLEQYFPTGEPTLQLVMTTGSSGKRLFEKQAFDQAAQSPALEFLSGVTPEPGCSILLLNAMGAFETYDDNRNGDAFPDRPVGVGKNVTCGHADCQHAAWVAADEVLSKHYKTFLKAHFFEHHKNKDPEKAFGDVMRAFWNVRMQRVELLVRLYESKNRKLAERIHAGEYPAVSMGCRVKYDVCNVCGHRAPTRAQYCGHAREKLRQVMPDGTKVCVHNPNPDFFDISAVFRPADPQGYMLKKVAEFADWEGWSAKAGEELDAWAQKVAEARKLSEIQKAILGQVVKTKLPRGVKEFEPTAKAEALGSRPTPEAEIDKLAQFPLSALASYLATQNQTLTTSDVTRILCKQANVHATEYDLDLVTGLTLALNELYVLDPSLREKIGQLVCFSDQMAERVKTANWGHALMARTSPTGWAAGYHAHAAPKTDILTLTDPNTGHQYQTTRGAAQDADWSNKRHALVNSVLLSSAYGLGLRHLGITKKLPWWVQAPMAAAAGVGTYQLGQELARPFRNPTYVTDQGISVPGNTEFDKTSAVDAVGTTSVLAKMAADFYERTGPSINPMADLYKKIVSAATHRKVAVFFSHSAEAQADLLYKSAAQSEDGVEYVDVSALVSSILTLFGT